MWLGVTVEDQPEACGRIPILLDIPRTVLAVLRVTCWIRLTVRPWLGRRRHGSLSAARGRARRRAPCARNGAVRDECTEAGAAPWCKQIGSGGHALWLGPMTGKGKRLGERPADLRIRKLPGVTTMSPLYRRH